MSEPDREDLTDAQKAAETEARTRMLKVIDDAVERCIAICTETDETRHIRVGVMVVRLSKHMGYGIGFLKEIEKQFPHVAANIRTIESVVKSAMIEGSNWKPDGWKPEDWKKP